MISSNIYMYYTYDNHLDSFSFMVSYVFLIWQMCFFFHIYVSITFEILYECVCTQNNNAHEVLSNSNNYVTFESHICFLISRLTSVFLVWQWHLFLQMSMKLSTAIHKYFIFGSHICPFRYMTTDVFLPWQNFFSFFMPVAFEIIHTSVSIYNTDKCNIMIKNILKISSYVFILIYFSKV